MSISSPQSESPASPQADSLSARTAVMSSWSAKSWGLWLLLPVIAILAGNFYIFSQVDVFEKDNYWQVQQQLFINLNSDFQVLPDIIWSNLTLLGDAAISVLILSLLIIWRPQAWAALVCSVPAAGIFSNVGKKLASMPRPGSVLDHADFNIIGSAVTGHSSFPSGHSISSFAVAIAVIATLVLIPKTRNDLIILIGAIVLATLMCLSRVAVGAHWPIDTLIGGALGWIAGLTGAFWASKQTGWWQKWHATGISRYILGLILLAWSIGMAIRGLDHPPRDLVIWLAALCGLITTAWLMRPLLNKKAVSED